MSILRYFHRHHHRSKSHFRPSPHRVIKTGENKTLLLNRNDLPRQNIPRSMAGILRRPRDYSSSEETRRLRLHMPRVERFPIVIGRRSVNRAESIGPSPFIRSLTEKAHAPWKKLAKQIPGEKSLCARRHSRRVALFKIGIAGVGKRRSPGKGGSYRRTEASNMVCD